jgi:hypothetical protein
MKVRRVVKKKLQQLRRIGALAYHHVSEIEHADVTLRRGSPQASGIFALCSYRTVYLILSSAETAVVRARFDLRQERRCRNSDFERGLIPQRPV